jgi:hypothetical protein
MQNKAIFYSHFDIFKQSKWGKMQLDGQFAWCLAAVERPASLLLQ